VSQLTKWATDSSGGYLYTSIAMPSAINIEDALRQFIDPIEQLYTDVDNEIKLYGSISQESYSYFYNRVYSSLEQY
jgi:hypothetical protein